VPLANAVVPTAKVTLTRKLAAILHRMWVSGSDFRYGTPTAAMEG
jgi:hypothetical protein